MSGLWEQFTQNDGSQLWFPTNAQQGQQYTDVSDRTWVFWNGNWFKTVYEQGELIIADDQPMVGAAEALTGLAPGVADQITDLENELKALGSKPVQRGQFEGDQAYKARLQIWLDERARIQGEINDLQGEVVTPVIDTSLDTLANYQDTLNNLVTQLNAGEVEFDPLTGQMTDSEGNVIEGAMSTWLSGMLAESYRTGNIAGDLYEIDEDGNLVMNESLQDMLDSFSTMDERTQGEIMEFNRQMAAHAIASGKSLNSGYYSEHVADIMAERNMQVTGQFSEMIMDEMQSQFDFIAQSMGDIMRGFMNEQELKAFNERMATEKAAIEEQMREQSELLAASVAEGDAARTGQIFTAIFSLIINLLLASSGIPPVVPI